MTVLDNAPRDQYTATSGQTVFPYTFEIAAAGDIKVLQNGTILNQGAGAGEYAVSGVGVDTGGNVTLVTGATTGDIITIYRDMAYERLTAYTNAGDFLAADVNNDFDRLWLALQQNGGDLDGRVLIAPNTDPTSINMTIPAKADREGKFLSFDSVTGNPTVTSISDVFGSGTLKVYNFVGDGTTTAFTLGSDPGVENNTQVYIDGVYQQKNGYTVSGTTLTFSAAPPNLSTIEVMVIQPTGVNATDAASVSFTQAGSNDTRTVQAKLEESVSVLDFGAVGDGVADDTAAIQAAIDSVNAAGGGNVIAPEGTYLCSSALTLKNNVILNGNGPKATILQFTSSASNGIEISDNTSKTGILNLKLYASAGSTGAGVYNASTTQACREFILDQYEIEGFLKSVRLSFGINIKIGQGRMIGQGKAVSGGIGLHLGDDSNIGHYGTLIEKAYISSFETGFQGEKDGGTVCINTIFEGNDFPVFCKSSSDHKPITFVGPYFEGNTSSNKLIIANTATVALTVINPFAYDTAPVNDFSTRVSGTNITIINTPNTNGYASPTLNFKRGEDDLVHRTAVYSTNSGHTNLREAIKSAQNTEGLTATANGEFIDRLIAYGVNSSSAQTKVAEMHITQDGSAGATYLGGNIAFKVGTNATAAVEALSVNYPSSGEAGILLLHNDGVSATLKRVKVGAADSGGAGFRSLIINN